MTPFSLFATSIALIVLAWIALGRPTPKDFFALHKREPTSSVSTIRIVAHTHLLAHLEFRDEMASNVHTIAVAPGKDAAITLEADTYSVIARYYRTQDLQREAAAAMFRIDARCEPTCPDIRLQTGQTSFLPFQGGGTATPH